VDAGAKYLSSQLQATGNNAIAAIGAYNGVSQFLCVRALLNNTVVPRYDPSLSLLCSGTSEWRAAELGLFATDVEWMVHRTRRVWR
jgi:soluble lytic murein transglycosylase-like protein